MTLSKKIFSAILLISMTACAATTTTSENNPTAKKNDRNVVATNDRIPAPASKPSTLLVDVSGAQRLGKKEATIGIVEFSDYQCPYCRDFNDRMFPRLKQEYIDTGSVAFFHRDYPLTTIHSNALSAALAARCAGEQDHFWQMHTALYANQQRLGPDLYLELVRHLGINVEDFSACLNATTEKYNIAHDVTEGRRLNVSGTPTFLIGKLSGDVLTVTGIANGLPKFEIFAQEIEKLLHPTDSEMAPPKD